jgi:hypothetical protein
MGEHIRQVPAIDPLTAAVASLKIIALLCRLVDSSPDLFAALDLAGLDLAALVCDV